MATNRGEKIFRRYSSALGGFIRKHLSSRGESEDLLQELFYKFLVADGHDNRVEDVSSWLYRVARNMLVDRSRKKKEEPMPYLGDQEGGEISLAELILCDGVTPESELVRTIIREELLAALERLPIEQRMVFELNELQGVEFKEISLATGIPINTLISRKRYAVLHLRKSLESLL
ncbi:MAG: sigma-70 family RNA polymerase sigma factor [Rikenellaceae bacterium]